VSKRPTDVRIAAKIFIFSLLFLHWAKDRAMRASCDQSARIAGITALPPTARPAASQACTAIACTCLAPDGGAEGGRQAGATNLDERRDRYF